MKVAVVTIGTGKYSEMLDPLCRSIRQNFLLNHKKELFVFSDKTIESEPTIYIDYLPSILNSLFKYFYMLKVESQLVKFDYVYYIDADCIVAGEVDEEVFCDSLVATLHPLKRENENHFEQNPISTAFVEDVQQRKYFQACFYGGTTVAVLEMAKVLQKNTEADLEKRLVAKWYDESHLNKYLVSHPPKILHGGYAFPDPERWKCGWSFPCKIIHKNYKSRPI